MVAFALAPVALATPESDAADVITRTYDGSGGPAGPMGPPDGGVYPIGAGFGQNYAGGKIFFTPETGAHLMGGAILAKYESLGGPADSDLGFPTIDEGPGRISPESRNSTFSASDKPVIFWTPETGAHVVRGAINAAWDKLGGSAGPLGVPTEDEVYNGDAVTQKFTGGELSWNRVSKKFATVPPELAGQLDGLNVPEDATSAINAARRAAGGALGPLGAKQGQQYAIGKDGAGQDFAGGKIFYSPATGANVVTGQVLKKYESVGGPEGDLGLPISSETDGGWKTGSRVSAFAAKDKPVIFWTPDYGAFIVRGAMNAAWTKLGGATGSMGPPVADQTEDGNVVSQRFTGGQISWDRQTNKFSTEPANLAAGLSDLQVPGYEPPETPAAPASAEPGKRNWFTPSWWWLLAGIPLAVLVALVLVATLRNRGGGHEESLDEGFDFDTARETAEAEEPRSADADSAGEDDSTAKLAESYARPPGSEPYGLGGLGRSDQDPFERAEDDSHDVADEFSDLEPEPDESDTAPTPIPTEEELSPGRHAAMALDEPRGNGGYDAAGAGEAAAAAAAVSGAAGLHEATSDDVDDAEDDDADDADEDDVEEDTTETSEAHTAIHLPLDDPYLAPDGYPIKADTRSGLYWLPDDEYYDHVPAEVYFVNEDFARANGFVRRD
ncbi:hypothetical protein CQY20_18850 [Mycolicibacterium agri]|uniref:LGFP repeat-containing protein n=1 Tax=Mycolicibacterium agri TaxID=36811 RepID=A0A2A7MY48_MYCAG|nr:LGFP repeat-containing protein [Mycolicibacterium agri]PEG36480.1 hypothetical protein CQY20_18850 [Mycolicibacterium agri]GFG49551.1 hypothetical protein MAGR_09920 [Mycolicibacterium agri]